MNTPKTVVVAQATLTIEATQIQMFLGSCGIESDLDGEMTITIDPLLSNAIGGIRVMVSEKDAEEASHIVAEYRAREKEAFEAKKRTCPKCGAENGTIRKFPVAAGILTVLTLGVFSLLTSWEKYKCPSCDHTWK